MEHKTFFNHNFLRNNYIKLGVACFLCYMGCYTGKTILSALSPLLRSQGVFTADQIGTMGSILFFSYGLGQLVNGTLGDHFSPKLMSFFGVTASGILVVSIPFLPNFTLNYVLWAFIGFFCSMLWGPLTRIIAENSSGDIGRKLMLGLNAALVSGTLAAYLIAAVVSAYFSWRVAFLVSGSYMILCGFVFYCIITLLERRHIIACSDKKSTKIDLLKAKEKLSLGLMMKNAFIPTVVFCMMNGFIRNAVSFWIPLYIKETYGVTDAFASSITVLLPIFNFIGTFLGLVMLKTRMFRKSEHVLSCFLFSIAVLTFALITLINGKGLVLTVICLVLASASMNSVCNLIYSVYVFRYKDTGRISTLTGALDCSAYVASGVGTKCIGLLVAAIGWNGTVTVWCLTAGIGAVACFASAFICKKNGVLSSGK